MTEFETRCYILPSGAAGVPVEADPARIAFSWQPETLGEHLAYGLNVAPGVRIAVLSIGDHFHPGGDGKVIHGALVAVRTKKEATTEGRQ